MPSRNSPHCTLTKKNSHKLTTLLNGGMFSPWMRLHGRCEWMMLWRTIKESWNFVKWAVYMQNGMKWIRPAVYMAAACNPLRRRHCATMGRHVKIIHQNTWEKKCSDKWVVHVLHMHMDDSKSFLTEPAYLDTLNSDFKCIISCW